MNPIECTFTFHPVGQGLFYSGLINDFLFVYDCGTENKQSYLDKEIAKFQRDKKVDLLVISHFHTDHIKGIKKLRRTTGGFKEVILPYLYPEEKLLLACSYQEQGSFDEGVKDFLFEPQNIFGDECAITYVVPGETEGYFTEPPNDPDETWSGKPVSDKDDDHHPVAQGESRKTKVRIDNDYYRTKIDMGLYWVFKFFCCSKNVDSERKRVIEEFKKQGLDTSASTLSNIISDEQLFETVKNIYVDLFGKNQGKKQKDIQNITSVICCHGLERFDKDQETTFFPYESFSRYRYFYVDHRSIEYDLFFNEYVYPDGKSIIPWQMLTGDTEIDISKYRVHFKTDNYKIGLFLLPHHGSSKNWENAFFSIHPNCLIWVCSYGLGNKHKHPNSSVVNGLLNRNLFLHEVNQNRSLSINAHIKYLRK